MGRIAHKPITHFVKPEYRHFYDSEPLPVAPKHFKEPRGVAWPCRKITGKALDLLIREVMGAAPVYRRNKKRILRRLAKHRKDD